MRNIILVTMVGCNALGMVKLRPLTSPWEVAIARRVSSPAQLHGRLCWSSAFTI